MNLHAEKIKLIEWLAGVTDVSLIRELSNFKSKSLKVKYEENLRPMTKAELTARAIASNEDIESGDVYSIDEIIK